MMDLIPENYRGIVVLNLDCKEPCDEMECRDCTDIGGVVHNWLMSSELPYMIVDLQDEKDICSTFLIELLQLQKRVGFPLLFTGVMEKARLILNSYSYSVNNQPYFSTPEEAVKIGMSAP